MINGWKLKGAAAVGAIAVLLAGCFNSGGNSMGGMDHSNMKMNMGDTENTKQNQTNTTTKTAVMTGKEFTLTAKAGNQELGPGKILPVWTFNNSVPGPEIRVKQGDTVKITLKNELPEPISIHWHGYPVPNAMDGVPGVTQNAVQPGQSFTYTFQATVPGTYWYHSHQDSANQVDRGLYGAFVVEPKDEAEVDRDYTLILDEWISTGMSMSGGNMSGSMSGMDHGNMGNMQHNMNMYDLYTINGKSGALVDKLPVKQGEKVRIRLINAGYITHQIHLHGHEFKITAIDGQPLNNPGVLKDQVVAVAPGERYDIEFEADNPGQWFIEAHGDNEAVKGMKAVVAYEGGAGGTDQPNEKAQLAAVDLTRYGQPATANFTLDQKYTLEYTMYLNTETQNGQTVYTINGKTFPNTEPIQVKKGDTVKVRIVNNSKTDDHPMHLHGHFFQVLSKNGKPFEGAPIIKDTLNLKPGDEYVVAFRADNEGNWMFHCHDLHHASAGMVTEVQYTDYQPHFTPDPKAGNKPE